MASFGQILLVLICARLTLSMTIGNVLSGFANDSDPLYSENFDHQLPNFEKAQCEKSENEIYLKFSNVGLKRIGQHFIDSLSVTCLSLNDNEITGISTEAFKQLPNLHFLDLSGNKVSKTDLLALGGLESLKTLVLDNVCPSSNNRREGRNYYNGDNYDRDYYDRRVTSPFDRHDSYQEKQYQMLEMLSLPNLESLYFRKNSVKSFSPSLQEFTPKLTNLHLSENNIGELSSLLLMFDMFPPSLTHLSLDQNSIRELSGQRLQNLVYVNFNMNKIKFLCNRNFKHSGLSLQKASRLRYLLLSGNEITHVDDDAFDDTSNLIHLDLSGNQIESFKDGTFDPLTELREFLANNNLLRNAPNLSTALNLRKINLSNNQITIIPKGAFSDLQLLKTLLLDGNRIHTIEEDAFSNLSSLEYLDLSRNGLMDLPANWMLTLTNLRVLLVKENLFTDFHDLSLDNATSLAELHVEDNRITHLNTRVFAQLPTNISVYLQNQSCSMQTAIRSTTTESSSKRPNDYYY